jgi:hypothetical protein
MMPTVKPKEFWENLSLSNPNIFCVKNNPDFKNNCAKLDQLRPGHLGKDFRREDDICFHVGDLWSEAFGVPQDGAIRKYNSRGGWNFMLLYITEGSDTVNGVAALEFRAPSELSRRYKFAPYLFIDALTVETDSRGKGICRELCEAATEVAALIWNDMCENPLANIWFAPDDIDEELTTNPFTELFVALNVDKPDTKSLAPLYERLGFRVADAAEDARLSFTPWHHSSVCDWAVDQDHEFRMLKNLTTR